uniref:hypothetical protein n=1 Tax=Aliarcobacter sp. TaxID=2321116 RepID=UPI004048A076
MNIKKLKELNSILDKAILLLKEYETSESTLSRASRVVYDRYGVKKSIETKKDSLKTLMKEPYPAGERCEACNGTGIKK